MMRWWNKWRARVWTANYLEAIGRLDDLKRGKESLAYRLADIRRWECESILVYHREKQGLSSPKVELPEHHSSRYGDEESK
jgi:hypothetical protein